MTWESLLTPQEARLYTHLFQTVSKTQEGIVTGAEAVRFFATSGVPNEILSEIWEAADRDKVGYLTPETFAIALKLIACAQHGKEAIEPVLATRVPLPQFDGVVAPSPMIANSTQEIPITAAEREKYASIFRVHQPVNGIMDAETARNVFLKSKLPVDTLSQIWNLADVRQSGTLNETEFIIAMHYIAKLMDGTLKTLPDKLPPVVFQSATGPTAQSPLVRNMASPAITRQASIMTPPQRARTIDSLGSLAFGAPPSTGSIDQDWDVTPQERQQFNVYFDKIDSAHSGYIQGKEAVEFFKNSRLPESELAHIWDLSDTQQRGSLSRDEFAVAMHLIHKRLRGGVLPQTLPRTLIPPSQRQQNNVFASPAFAASSPAPVPPASILDTNNDLLGDFGNDQVATETNQVNLLQNQITSMSSQTVSLKNQKASTEHVLEQLTQQRKHLEAQMVDVKTEHEKVVKELNELQEQVRREEAEWDRVRSEYNAAQQQLVAVQNETAQVNQTLENGRAETESLKRRIFEIQEETRKVNAELDKLRAQSKQQGMMLDINRRQVTAAEQDRALAERNLQDYKVAAGLTNEVESSSDDESVEEQKEPLPQPTPSVVSTPALDNLFGTPSAQTSDKHVPSPFDEFAESITKGSTFESPQNDAPAPQDDFDAIFGKMSISTPAADTLAHAFDPIQWPTSPTSVTTKSSRGPPPPPPQSRHHRQASISSAASSTVGAKKQRAPPPPPPAIVPSSSSIALEKIADAKEQNDEDDFEAAFSGKLPEAKIVAKDDQFEDFDDAFSIFETNKSAHNIKPVVASSNDDWAAAFEPFKPEQKKSEEPKANDDWDSIFGVPSAPADNTAPATQHATGFDDSFSSFADDFGKQKTPKSPSATHTTAQTTASGVVGDKVQDLIKMGFGEKEAKDALNRYDQDLEKASNFLLDQVSK